ncbi:hypothetical protein E2C01_058908 [Portunus trituberculatus]|uniref:Uncharacterized protein n=1 Tax=Portunus trituberculatus TaxID=210409 RepID=A0A5B7H5Z5_PORTR|nr:hypothetical protein [Portunus trituberculatus]
MRNRITVKKKPCTWSLVTCLPALLAPVCPCKSLTAAATISTLDYLTSSPDIALSHNYLCTQLAEAKQV